MKRAILYLAGSIFLLLFSSCLRVEIPTHSPLTAPMIREKGEIRARVEYGFNSGLNTGLTYALTNHCAVVGNFQLYQQDGNVNNWYRGNYYVRADYRLGELGIGYFRANGSKKNIAEGYVMLGYGSSDKEYIRFHPLVSNADIVRLALTMDYGFRNDNFEICFGARGLFTDFLSLKAEGYIPFNEGYPVRKNSLLIPQLQPFIQMNTAGLGFKNLKFSFQLGFSTGAIDEFVAANEVFANIGLQVRLFGK